MRNLSRARRIAIFIFVAPIGIFVLGWVTMQLWNNVLAQVVHISTITFWQAWGLIVLSKILFGGFSGGSNRRAPYMRKRMQERWAKIKAAESKTEEPAAE